jgi:DNA-binding transcriptional MerR regulator
MPATMSFTRRILITLALCCCARAYAGETYIFTDENGVQVISNAIPPHLARRGYKVVDSDTLRTLRVVPPESTPATPGAAPGDPATEGRTRHRTDEQLRTMYASVEDLRAARDRKLRDLDVEIERVEAQLESERAQNEKFEQQAAAWERSGMGGTPGLRENIQKLEQRIAQHEEDLEKRRRERDSEETNFQYEIRRMECLTRTRSGPECTVPQ